MPKVNVYLPDGLAAEVRATGVAVSAVCQQALSDAVRSADPVQPPTTDAEATTARIGFTRRAHNVVVAATDAGDTSLALLEALLDSEGLVVAVLAGWEIESDDLRAELSARRPGTRLDPVQAVVDRAVEQARALEQSPLGTEHLLLGLAAGDTEERCARTLTDLGLTREHAVAGVRVARATWDHARRTAAITGLAAPVRAAVEDIRVRLDRIENRIGQQDPLA
ncbi:MAG TPA: hypothetical protein IAA98_01355 [Candidatus Avipropionibacterium avicola]|uniref:Clp R domain-containing protein n=1 Tax=Candidatus Avipropionibacterium avicola TaxID=2840701 RepID=A0A9D1GVR8_9ACTN|nr:hypothetical protein [Candidatus Avipropionibacterium avicola]